MRTETVQSTSTEGQTARLQHWADQINCSDGKHAQGTIAHCKIVAAAKAALKRHGEWTQLCRSGIVPFKKAKGDMLVFVGTKLGVLKEDAMANLPSGWSILHCLALLPSELLQEKIAARVITPLITLAEAKELAAPYRKPKKKKHEVDAWIKRTRDFIDEESATWNPDQTQRVVQALQELAETINVDE